jgi:hypothetical protein
MTDPAPTTFLAAMGQSPDACPWLPLRDETAQEYYEFWLWRGMTPRPQVSYRVAIRNQWAERALAWDDYRLSHPDAPVQSPEERRAEDASIIQVLKYTLKREAVKIMAQLERSSSPGATLETIIKCADALVKLDRLIHNESTDNVSVRAKVDLSGLDDSDLRDLDRLSEKAKSV